MATRKKADGQSPLAAAQAERGRDPGGVIASSVVDRIVSNSTREFQDYLASTSAGNNAMAAATQAIASVPPPMPEPVPVPVPVPQPPALMPTAAPPMTSPVSAGFPMPPNLGVGMAQPSDPGAEQLLRYFGLI